MSHHANDVDAVAALKQIYAVLMDDCVEADRLLQASDTPCLWRLNVRVWSSFVEGMAFGIRRVVREGIDYIRAHESASDIKHEGDFQDFEIDWLYEKKKLPKEIDGERLSGMRLRVALVCYAKLYMQEINWTCFDKLDRLAEVRDRLTHPESATSLEISDADREDIRAATKAIFGDMSRLFATCNAKA